MNASNVKNIRRQNCTQNYECVFIISGGSSLRFAPSFYHVLPKPAAVAKVTNSTPQTEASGTKAEVTPLKPSAAIVPKSTGNHCCKLGNNISKMNPSKNLFLYRQDKRERGGEVAGHLESMSRRSKLLCIRPEKMHTWQLMRKRRMGMMRMLKREEEKSRRQWMRNQGRPLLKEVALSRATWKDLPFQWTTVRKVAQGWREAIRNHRALVTMLKPRQKS